MLTWRSAVVLGVVILALAMLLPALRAYLDQQNSLGALRAEAQTARTEVSDLEAEVERWQDPAFIVAEARERLAYVFPGETPYRVVDPEFVEVAVVQAAQTQAGESDTFDGPWFNALWQSVSAAGNGPDAAESANDVAGDGAAADDVAGDDGPVSDGPATEAPTPGGSEEDGPIGFGE
jgi:cell division protein FtsB